MTNQCVSLSTYLLKGTEKKKERKKIRKFCCFFFLKEKTDTFSSSEQVVESCSAGQGQHDKIFLRDIKGCADSGIKA